MRLFLMLICGICFADENKYLACFIKASQYYNVPQEILTAIASVESNFNPNAYTENSNHSYDIGLMQINSSWLPKLSELNITEDMLYDPCQSIYVGAWILSNNIRAYGGLNWTAVQRYNGNDVELRYATKIYDRINQLFVDSPAKLIPVAKTASVPIKNNQEQVDEILAKSGIKSLSQQKPVVINKQAEQSVDTILAKTGITIVSETPKVAKSSNFKQFFTQNQPKGLAEFIQNTLAHVVKPNYSEVVVEPCKMNSSPKLLRFSVRTSKPIKIKAHHNKAEMLII